MSSRLAIWLPVLLGLCVYSLTIPLIMVCFEGPILGINATGAEVNSKRGDYSHLPYDGSNDDDDDETDDASENDSDNSDMELPNLSFKPTIRRRFPGANSDSTEKISPWASMLQMYSISIRCLLPCIVFLFRDFGESLRFVLPYWMSRRYHLKLREVGWVQLCDTLFTALVVALMPQFSNAFLKEPVASVSIPIHTTTGTISPMLGEEAISDGQDEPGLKLEDSHRIHTSTTIDTSARDQDLALSKICLLFSFIGSLLIGLSWYRFSAFVSLAVTAGGAGFSEAYYSYLASRISKSGADKLSDVYMILSMVSLAAMCLGGWIVSGVYSVALRLGGETWATSAPIWVCTGAFGVAWCILNRYTSQEL